MLLGPSNSLMGGPFLQAIWPQRAGMNSLNVNSLSNPNTTDIGRFCTGELFVNLRKQRMGSYFTSKLLLSNHETYVTWWQRLLKRLKRPKAAVLVNFTHRSGSFKFNAINI